MTRARFLSLVGLRLRAFGAQPPSESGPGAFGRMNSIAHLVGYQIPAHNTAGRADHRPGQNHVCYTDEHRHQIRDSAWTVGRVSGQGPVQCVSLVTDLGITAPSFASSLHPCRCDPARVVLDSNFRADLTLTTQHILPNLAKSC